MGASPGRGVSGNMRRLFVVGYSADHGGIVLTTRKGAKSGSYLLEVDEAVLDVLEGVGRRRPGGVPVSTRSGGRSELSPREIQARLRAGHSVEEVAAQAGVGVDWIDRFASPVMAELASAISRAAQTVLHTADRGPSERPLEASVLRNLASRGVVLDEQELQSAWTARHLVDTEWCVAFRFRNRGREVVAEWGFNAHTGALSARNRAGEELGYVGPAPEPVAAGRTRRSRPAGSPAPTDEISEATLGAERTVAGPAGAVPAAARPAGTAQDGRTAPAPEAEQDGRTVPAPETAREPEATDDEVAGTDRTPAAQPGGGEAGGGEGGDVREGETPGPSPAGTVDDRQPRLPLPGLPRSVPPTDAGSRD